MFAVFFFFYANSISVQRRNMKFRRNIIQLEYYFEKVNQNVRKLKKLICVDYKKNNN